MPPRLLVIEWMMGSNNNTEAVVDWRTRHVRGNRRDAGNSVPLAGHSERSVAVLWFFHLPHFWKALLSSFVALLTLAGIMIRPFRWNEARIAMSGAGILLVLGLISPAEAFFTGARTISH